MDAQRRLARRLVDAFDDAEVALDAVGEGHQRLLVCLALVCRDGLFKAVELDQNDALHDSGLVGNDSTATGQGARPSPPRTPTVRGGAIAAVEEGSNAQTHHHAATATAPPHPW